MQWHSKRAGRLAGSIWPAAHLCSTANDLTVRVDRICYKAEQPVKSIRAGVERGRVAEAMPFAGCAIHSTPTLAQVHIVAARVLKSFGMADAGVAVYIAGWLVLSR